MKQKNERLVLKNAKIPFLICIKLAFKNIWKKKFQFLVLVLFCGISLAFLSFTIELNGDILRQNVYTMVENGYRYTEIYEYSPSSKESIKEDPYNQYSYQPLKDNSYDTIKKNLPELTINKYQSVSIDYAGIKKEESNFFYTGYISTIIEYDKTNNYDLICGRKPIDNSNEILITDYLVAGFKHFGLYSNCNNIVDYLNQKIHLNQDDYTIVGILKTNYEKWSKYAIVNDVEKDKTNYSYANDIKMINSVVLTSPYFEIEKNGTHSTQKFQKTQSAGTHGTDWAFTNTTTPEYVYSANVFYNTYEKPEIARFTWGNRYFGRMATADNEIVIPKAYIKSLFNETYSTGWDFYSFWQENIENHLVTLSITDKTTGVSYKKDFTIVGITTSTTTIQTTKNDYFALYNTFQEKTENILMSLPSNPETAYNLFLKAYNKGNTNEFSYILNVWAYKTDIASYTVDPLINLVAKGGAFVFILFTIGIMWTIVAIDIVDSKKEIGILRSIGLPGNKVSFIFIFQTLLASLLAYGLALLLANKIIPWYNSGITDSLGVITLYMYTMTWRSYVYLFIFVIAMTLITTLIPLSKIMHKKIIDVINERE